MFETTNRINEIIKSIFYISFFISLLLFITIKLLKYLLERKKFNFLSTLIISPLTKLFELPNP